MRWFLFLFGVLGLFFVGCVDATYRKVPQALGLPRAERIVTPTEVTIRQDTHTFVFHRGKRTALLDGVLYYLHGIADEDSLNAIDCQLIRYGLVTPSIRKPKLHVLLDPGHGGSDPGCMANDVREKDITLAISLEMKRLLEAKGHYVSMTRTTAEKTLTLSERSQVAQQPLDAFISIHVNAATNPATKGVEVFTIPAPGFDGTPPNSPARTPMLGQVHLLAATRLAMAVQRELLTLTPQPIDRGVKHAHFKVLRDTPAPSILVETGFLTNEDDFKVLTSVDAQKQIAQAIVSGLEKAFVGSPLPTL